MSAFTRQLIHTCTIQSQTTTRSSSGAEVPTWANAATAVPCRYMELDNDQPAEGRTEQFRKRTLIQFKPDVTLLETYRITDVALEDGTTLAGPFEILEIIRAIGRRKQHHIAAEVRS